MTQISTKIGRFMCDSATVDDSATSRISRCCDDVISGIPSSRTSSEIDLKQSHSAARKLSLPEFQKYEWSFGARRLEEKGERRVFEESDVNDLQSWTEDFNNRTLLPHENDRMLKMFRVIHLEHENAEGYESGDEDDAEAEKEPAASLPWRSTEEMAVLEDTSKYIIRDSDDFNDLTPQINFVTGDEAVAPFSSFYHSSSSSSFRNLPPVSLTRPDLSNCHSLSLSQWLSEAESRHSEPFCPQHHHILISTSAVEPSIRSSIGLRNRQTLDQPNRDRFSRSSSRAASPLQIPDDIEGSMSRHELVLMWLMACDLTDAEQEESGLQLDLTDHQLDV